MMQNVINSAFECVATVAAGVELVGTFDFLAKREAIRRTVDRKAIDVYGIHLIFLK
jgi:dynein heavy chain